MKNELSIYLKVNDTFALMHCISPLKFAKMPLSLRLSHMVVQNISAILDPHKRFRTKLSQFATTTVACRDGARSVAEQLGIVALRRLLVGRDSRRT